VAKQSKLAGLLSPLARWVTSSRLYPSEGLFKDRSLSLRWYLVLLVAGTLLPVVLFAVVVVYKLSNQEQAAAERRMLLAARNLASKVDYELSSTIRTLDALAVSQQLYAGDLEGFHQEANRLVEKQPAWLTVILLSPEGQQVMNSQRPLGTPLPLVNEPNSLRRLVATEQPVVGDLAPGSLTQTLAFPVRVPIIQDGELKYGLTAVISPEALTNVVVEEQAPVEGEWTRTIVDGQGIVVARTRDPERFVGQRGTPSFLKSISETNEGIFRNTTLDGVKVYVAFSRIRGTPLDGGHHSARGGDPKPCPPGNGVGHCLGGATAAGKRPWGLHTVAADFSQHYLCCCCRRRPGK
jgi:hypothetical protein